MGELGSAARPLRLLLLGGTGGCGSLFLKQAVARGHAVATIVREGSSFEGGASVRIFRGDPTDRTLLQQALKDTDLVVSCMGLRRSAPWNPWSRLVSPPNLMETMARLWSEELPRAGVSKLLAVSAAGVGDSANTMNPPMQFLVAKSNVGVAYRDLGAMENILAQSSLDWIAVRPVTLTHREGSRPVGVVEKFGTFASIARGDVAGWLLSLAENWNSEARTPMIANRG